MHQRYRLTQEQQARLDHDTAAIINSLPDIGTAQVGHELRHQIREAAENGDREAELILEDWQLDGATKQARRMLKKDRTVVRLLTGREVSVPTRVGVRAVDSLGNRQAWYQQPLWYELSWPRFLSMIAGLETQRDQLSTEIAAYSQVLNYRTRFPESRTPLEACERAGIDPTRIGFDEKVA